MPRPAVFLITGPMAAGKTTVARLLAQRFERGVHLEGDVFRRSIVSGRVEMTPDPTTEALAQLRLRYRLAATVADAYAAAGAREEARAEKGYGAWTIEQLYDGFARATPRLGSWLDTTQLAPAETVDQILALTAD